MIRNTLFILLLCVVLEACTPTTPIEPATLEPCVPSEQNGEDGGVGLPNPASVYCEEQGYHLEMREGEGGIYGVCIFPDGSECDEWAYFRGECKPGDSSQAGAISTTPDILLAEDGCQVYQNELLGYTLHYPADALIESDDDPLKTITITGPLIDNEHWPIIYVSHPYDREEFLPPVNVDLEQWLVDHELLMASDEDLQPSSAEVRQEDIQISGETAVHTRFDRTPQSYAYDKYFFAHNGQLYSIVILHTGDKEDWDLYNHFLLNFQFEM